MNSYYFTYVLKSKKDNKLYIGWTNKLMLRLQKHNGGQVKATKDRVPFELVYFEGCLQKHKAIEREKQLKTGFGRLYLKKRI